MNKVMGTYFVDKGINLQKSMSHFHKQVGNIARENRTTQAMMLVLLKD